MDLESGANPDAGRERHAIAPGRGACGVDYEAKDGGLAILRRPVYRRSVGNRRDHRYQVNVHASKYKRLKFGSA